MGKSSTGGDQNGSEFIAHEPCPSCGSKDNLARYSDGHAYCFGCGSYQPGTETASVTPVCTNTVNTRLLTVEHVPLGKRRISEETCRLFDYGVANYNGNKVQVATYRDETGVAVAQKVRTQNKDFRILGASDQMLLYGRHLWKAGGRMVVVTEGEIDALSVSQVQGNKWPVVSIPNGAHSAVKAIKKNLDWLEQFETVVFMFDMDAPGQVAAQECAALLSPGKAKIARLDAKDPNELLVSGQSKKIIDGMWQAKVFRPDGIVAGTELWESISSPPEADTAAQYPWPSMNNKTYGLRSRELVTLCSGSGIGKSSVCREIAHSLIMDGHTIGYIALEESVRRTALGLMGIHMNRPLHIEVATGSSEIPSADLKSAFEATVGSGRVFLYDHFGSMDSENLLSRIRYMVRALNCKWIFLDHLSIVVSGMGDGDERRLIDNTMTSLRSLVEELGCGLILVSHLKRPEGRGHEEGAQTSLAQLRGSAAIGQLSDMVIGLERNQQAEDNPDQMVVRVLKNRFSGDTGPTSVLTYDRNTGRLSETGDPAADGLQPEPDEQPEF